jgi:hypothetical protein
MPIVREFNEKDLEQIEEIHRKFHAQHFSFPEIANAYARIVVSDGNKILGYGQIKDLTEAEMILDLSLPVKTREFVLTELIREAVFSSKKHRNEEHIHSFVTNPRFGSILQKHYGFRECKGKALVKEI